MSREFLEEFIYMYQSEPCLWQVKIKQYHDRVKRDAAYERLIEKLKTIEPNACKDTVVKKINNIRSAYRKEIKKVKASQKSGAGTEEVYEPKLWYFKFLRFLDDQDTPRSSRSNIGSDEDEEITSNNEENDGEEASQDNTASTESETREDVSGVEHVHEANADQSVSAVPPQRRPSKTPRVQERQQQSLTNEVLLTVKEHFKTPRAVEDRFDVFGRTVAIKLRSLPREQMLFAEKHINDTLFQAEMGKLTLPRLVGDAIPQFHLQHFNRHYSPYPSPNFPHSHSPRPTFSVPSTSIQPQQQYQETQSQLEVTESQQEPAQPVANYVSQFDEL